MRRLILLLFLTCLVLIPIVGAQSFNIYVSDAGNFNNPPWQILKFDPDGTNGQVYIDENLAWPQDIVFLENQGVVLISNLNSGNITKYDATSGSFMDNFATGIGGPTRMKIGDDDLLYVLQWTGNGTVHRYELDGTFVGEFTAQGVNQSIGLDWDSDGNLYVSSYADGTVRKFDSSGADLGLFIDDNLSGPTNIYFDDIGDLYVLDWNAGNVKRFDSNGNFIEIAISGLSQPEGVAFYPDGSFLIGDGGNSSVKKYMGDGTLMGDIIMSGAAGLMQPNAVILRDNTLGLGENHYNTILVTPSVGKKFFINPSNSVKFDLLEIYTLNGKKVDSIPLKQQNSYDASLLSEGIYLIIASGNGKKATQKIIVR